MGPPIKQFIGYLTNYSKTFYKNRLNESFTPVSIAPEPSDVIWENLSCAPRQKMRRRILATVLTGVLVIFCFIALISITAGQV